MENLETTITFNRKPFAEDYLFEPFGLHQFTQNKEIKSGDLVIEKNGQKVILPIELLRFHQAWLNAPDWLKSVSCYFYDFIFLEEDEKREMLSFMQVVSREIDRKRKIDKRKAR